MRYFPFPFIPRSVQTLSLAEVEYAIRNGYHDIIITAPTGSGKSVIAATLAYSAVKKDPIWRTGRKKEGEEEEEGAEVAEDSDEEEGDEDEDGGDRTIRVDILTATTFLQNQYLRDFRDMRTIMGKGNFICPKYKIPVSDVPYSSECRYTVLVVKEEGTGNRSNSSSTGRRKKVERRIQYCQYHPRSAGNCPYYVQKYEGLNASIRVLNYHMYLTLLMRGEFEGREGKILIMDEAHTIEDMVVDFFSVTISRREAKNLKIQEMYDDILRWKNNNSNSNYSSTSSTSSNYSIISERAVNLLGGYIEAYRLKRASLLAEKEGVEIRIAEVELMVKRMEEGEEEKEKENGRIRNGKNSTSNSTSLLGELEELKRKRVRLLRRISRMEWRIQKTELVYNHMRSRPEDYLIDVIIDDSNSSNGSSSSNADSRIRFIPLNVRIFHSFISRHAEYRIYMSATASKELLCSELGIPRESVYHIDLPSLFPAERRRVHLLNVAKLNNGNVQDMETIRRITESIRQIMEKHRNERGLILVPSYRLAEMLSNSLSEQCRSRILLTRWRDGGYRIRDRNDMISDVEVDGDDGDGEDNGDAPSLDGVSASEAGTAAEAADDIRRRIIAEHASRSDSVMLSVNMWEGVDLKDDLCRFIVIVKVPFPDLSDIRNRTKLEREEEVEVDGDGRGDGRRGSSSGIGTGGGGRAWYQLHAIQKMIQGSGRGMRHENDYCTTYILDSNASWLLKQRYHDLPAWFREALVWKSRQIDSRQIDSR